jgi:hypothetical protein
MILDTLRARTASSVARFCSNRVAQAAAQASVALNVLLEFTAVSVIDLGLCAESVGATVSDPAATTPSAIVRTLIVLNKVWFCRASATYKQVT